MAYEKKSKEDWERIRRENNLQKTVDNVAVIRDAVTAAKIQGDPNTALMTVLIAELMKLNDQIYWIQKSLKPKTYTKSDDVPF
jgi:hypothetical protein